MLAYVYLCIPSLLSESKVSSIFTMPYPSLGIYIISYVYMLIQNIQFTDYSLSFCASLSKVNIYKKKMILRKKIIIIKAQDPWF